MKQPQQNEPVYSTPIEFQKIGSEGKISLILFNEPIWLELIS